MSIATVKRHSGTQRIALWFYLRQNVKQTVIIAWIAAISAASSLVGFINTYPDEASRQAFVSAFTGNTGLKLLLGATHDIASVGGFVAWRTLGILVLIGSVWGLMLSTKLFRGEEQAGRTELLLSGRTTLRRITVQFSVVTLVLSSLIFLLVFAATYASSVYKHANLSVTSLLFFSLSLMLAVLVFMAIGAVSGQLFATRAQAMQMGAIVFGIAFLLRGLGASVKDVHFLNDLSPIGWVQNLQPFTGSHWQWLIPIVLLIGSCYCLAIWLAGRRDIQASIFADNNSAPPKYRMLGSPLGLWIRMSRTSVVGWLIGLATMSYMFGTVAKTAGDSVASSAAAQNIVSKLVQNSQAVGEKLFYGMVFLIVMLLVLVMVAGMLSAIREEESQGYLDNLLVRSIARVTVIKDRLLILVAVVSVVAFTTVFAGWLGGKSQHASVSFSTLLPAVANTIATAILLIGIGLCVYGFKPRLTSVVVYGVVGWAFLAEMIGAILNLNHWILDTSLLHHIPLVPAASVHWQIIWMYGAIGIVLTIIGTLRFTKRDIEAN